MGLHGITQLIDTFNSSVGCGIKTDAVIGAADIVVNGAGDADNIDSILAQGPSSVINSLLRAV